MLPLIFLMAQCVFTPPAGWQTADPKMPSKRAIVGFIDKRVHGFCPSLNLTHEQTPMSLEEYLLTVERSCRVKKQSWKHLGKIQTQAGPAELVEIEVQTKFGPARLVQAILKSEKDIWILTGGALKKDFGKQASLFEQTFRSMTLCDVGKKSEAH